MNCSNKILSGAKEVFEIEAKELLNVANTLDEQFSHSVNAIFGSKGKCIITGMGKSGIIGRKIAASLSSTGTSSFFVHPGEAFHGDLGMFEKDDVVILLSNSGETDEVLKLLSYFQYQGNTTISITSNSNSTLAKNTTFHILCRVDKEACPLQLAPTSSTTAALVMGDAIVVSLINLRNFKPENFARFHPGGSLGRKLLSKVADVMYSENLPTVTSDTNIRDVIHVISDCGYGLAVEVGQDNKILGLITDGDIRRAMEKYEEDFFSLMATDISTKSPVLVESNLPLNQAGELFSSGAISSVLVVNADAKFVGILASCAL
jgi:arabinose-5-phosphate isomerase